jgi:hypothetical protein
MATAQVYSSTDYADFAECSKAEITHFKICGHLPVPSAYEALDSRLAILSEMVRQWV